VLLVACNESVTNTFKLYKELQLNKQTGKRKAMKRTCNITPEFYALL
jgi:hypothetical protein